VLAVSVGCKRDKGTPVAQTPVNNPDKGGPTIPREPVPLGEPAPRIDSFTVEPARIERGQAITLRWNTTAATTATIDQGIGTVAASGSRQMFPTGTTTYVLIARNAVGSDTRTATVEVVAGPTSTPSTGGDSKGGGGGGTQPLISQLQDILFDYDMSELRNDARRALNTDADLLKQIFAMDTRISFVIEGHADDRGSAEYNLGLADRRAIIVRDSLVQLGVPANRLRTVSFGEEAPVCREAT
jgi:peptidoglycan-associated lipoprotein